MTTRGARVKTTIALYSFLALWQHAWAQEKNFKELPYPAGKSVIQVEGEIVEPYFLQVIGKPIHYGDLSFTLAHLLAQKRQDFLAQKDFDADKDRKKISGATVNIGKNKIQLADGETLSIRAAGNDSEHMHGNFDIVLANFDYGVGLFLDFAPMPYKAYLSPDLPRKSRAFTVSPGNIYWDKDYDDFDHLQSLIKEPAYYFALLDAVIRGDFSLASQLPLYEQEALVDVVTISIAECYAVAPAHTYWKRSEFRAQGAFPVYDAIVGQFYNHGGWQILPYQDTLWLERNDVKVRSLSPGVETPEFRYTNEEAITNAIKFTHPYEFFSIMEKTHYADPNNIFYILAYFIAHPETYDEETRINLRRIILSLSEDSYVINNYLQGYVKIIEIQ